MSTPSDAFRTILIVSVVSSFVSTEREISLSDAVEVSSSFTSAAKARLKEINKKRIEKTNENFLI